MALTYHGNKSIGACIPIAGVLSAQASLALGPLILELTAKLQGYLQMQAALNLTLPALQVQATLQGLLALKAQLELSVVPPSASIQLSVVVGLIAALNLQLGALNAALDLVAELEGVLAGAGVHLYSYTGPSSGLRDQMPAQFPGGGPGDACGAVVLATNVTAVMSSLGTTFGVELST